MIESLGTILTAMVTPFDAVHAAQSQQDAAHEGLPRERVVPQAENLVAAAK
jgi:hypothetical protein